VSQIAPKVAKQSFIARVTKLELRHQKGA